MFSCFPTLFNTPLYHISFTFSLSLFLFVTQVSFCFSLLPSIFSYTFLAFFLLYSLFFHVSYYSTPCLLLSICVLPLFLSFTLFLPSCVSPLPTAETGRRARVLLISDRVRACACVRVRALMVSLCALCLIWPIPSLAFIQLSL